MIDILDLWGHLEQLRDASTNGIQIKSEHCPAFFRIQIRVGHAGHVVQAKWETDNKAANIAFYMKRAPHEYHAIKVGYVGIDVVVDC